MSTKDINFWLNEKDLKTPKHDEIVLWCFNNAEKIISELNLEPKLKGYSFSRFQDNLGSWDWERFEFIIKEDLSEYLSKNAKIFKQKIEEDYKKFVSEIQSRKKLFEINKQLEKNLSQPNGWNIGFIDLYFLIKINSVGTEYFREIFSNDYESVEIYLEIKPKVESIGEVMRQINYYRNYSGKAPFVLVTESEGIKEIFQSQNVLVYEYKKENGK